LKPRPSSRYNIAFRIFLTTDDDVVKRMRGFVGIAVMDPTQFVIEVD
jgi:hypothetical protein